MCQFFIETKFTKSTTFMITYDKFGIRSFHLDFQNPRLSPLFLSTKCSALLYICHYYIYTTFEISFLPFSHIKFALFSLSGLLDLHLSEVLNPRQICKCFLITVVLFPLSYWFPGSITKQCKKE